MQLGFSVCRYFPLAFLNLKPLSTAFEKVCGETFDFVFIFSKLPLSNLSFVFNEQTGFEKFSA